MSLLLPKFLYRYLQKKFDLPSPIDKRESIIQSILMPPGGSKAKWSDHDYENFAKETYLKNIIAFRCIDEIGTAVASVKWKVYERKKSGKPVETLTHPVAELIRRPNTEDSYSFLMLKKASFLVMDGNAYEERITPLDGPNVEVPKELYVHRPDRIHIEVGNGRKTGYVYEVEGREKTWRIDPINGECDLWHYKTFHPINDWYGAAVTESAAREIDTSNEATEWNKKMLENEGRPGMVITIVGKNLTDERFEKLEKMLKEKHTGPEHAGANMILEGEKGTTAQPYGWTPKDMDFMEGNRDLSRRIALGFKVPPMLLSIPGDATFSNFEEARLAFWEETVFFYLNFFRDEGNNWHFPKDNRFYLDYALDEIPALAPKRHRMWERAQKSQFITINEKREMVNLPPIDAGDVILVPSNMVPLDILQKEFSEGIENITGNEGTAKKKLMEKGYTEEEAMNLLGLH